MQNTKKIKVIVFFSVYFNYATFTIGLPKSGAFIRMSFCIVSLFCIAQIGRNHSKNPKRTNDGLPPKNVCPAKPGDR